VANSKISPIRTGLRRGAREAFGPAAAVMTAGFIGFGALASDSGMPFWIAALATALMWALPGQIILVEMVAAKAGVIAIVLAVWVSAVRFLPTGMSMMPMMRMREPEQLKKLLVAQFVASTSWVLSMRNFPQMPVAERAPWLVGFGTMCTIQGITLCGIGYLLAGTVPKEIHAGLVYVTPIYFLLLMFGDIRSLTMGVAVTCGAIAVPVAHLITPHWSLLAGGVAGGTAAYLFLRAQRVQAHKAR
jgi:predicted branched-subunit amino acid permease